MQILILIASLLTAVVVAQQPSINCNYYFSGNTYDCGLSINNPNGYNDFTEIGGIHLEGFTNANVSVLYRTNGSSSIVPSIICETFPNLVQIYFYSGGLTEIDDSAFSGCSLVTTLYLYGNRITSITPNAFVNLPYISVFYLDGNLISTLPENVFANQQNLTDLDLGYNPFNDIPSGLFHPLQNLRYLYLSDANISAINNQWFATNDNLFYLYLPRNRITLAAGNFVGLENLRSLNLASNEINGIPGGTFAGLPNLQTLSLADNNFTGLQADSFPDLTQLATLDISYNAIEIIHVGAFRGLSNLIALNMERCRIEELPAGTFVAMSNLSYIGLWANRLKTLRRNSFGTLTSLQVIDLDQNVVNALDRAIIDDAVNLNTLFFGGNICASQFFGSFEISRAIHLPIHERCFRNALYIVDAVTEAGAEFSFFEGPQPGIALRVSSGNEVQIALTPFNFLWTPVIEILIGTTNNTRSAIRVNQEENVVTVPTPNIIVQNQWNDFRVTWANQVILVFSGNNTYPFMGYTMENVYQINFYGLRAVETATWTVQPLE